MNKRSTVLALLVFIAFAAISFKDDSGKNAYTSAYNARIKTFSKAQAMLIAAVDGADMGNPQHIEAIRVQLQRARLGMKGADFWLRYLDPLQYKKINSPL